MGNQKLRVFCALLLGLQVPLKGAAAESEPVAPAENQPVSLWKSDIGEGYRKGAKELDVLAGVGLGMKVLQSVGTHDWGIGIIDYGWVFTDVSSRSADFPVCCIAGV